MKGKFISRYGTQLDTRFLGVESDFKQLDGKRFGEDTLYNRPNEGNRNREINIEGQPYGAGQRYIEEVICAAGK